MPHRAREVRRRGVDRDDVIHGRNPSGDVDKITTVRQRLDSARDRARLQGVEDTVLVELLLETLSREARLCPPRPREPDAITCPPCEWKIRLRHSDIRRGRNCLDRLVQRARILLWKGHCSVHARFTVRQIEQLRAQHPGIRVIVHPEVPWDVVQAADDAGSTEHIIKTVKNSPAGSTWAVGTEIHLVNRLAREVAPERTVHSLDQFGCLCSTMFRVSPNHLLWVLEGLLDGEVHNRIVVPDAQKHWTKVALDRMLSIS